MNNNYIQVITDEGNLILDLTGKENISFNFLISDIKDISKKKTNYSKSISLPGTKNNHKVFQNIFEITSDNIFNPNKSVNCQFIADGVAVITGKLKLNKINSDLYSNNISYDIVIYSGNFDLVNLLGDKKLVDLNLSGFNHTINSATVVNSWDGTTPYVYPFCDTGAYYTYTNINPNGLGGGFVEFMDFTPWLYVKPLLNKIFEESNLSIQSDFFNSDLFSKLIINTTNKLKYTAEELKAQRFRAEQVSGVIDIQNPLIAVTPTLSSVTVNDDYTVGFDPGNVYNTSTGEIQFPFNNFPTSFELGLNWKDNGFSTASIDFVLRIYLYKNGQVVWDNGQYINCNGNNLLNGTWVFNTPQFITNPSDVFQFKIGVETQNPFVGVLQLEAGTYIQNIPGLFDDWLMVGDTVNISNFINPNTKCIDFVSAIFKTFNLYVEPLNTDLSTFVVEPRNNFYLNTPATVVDWTSKIDSFKPIQQTLLSELQSKKFIFTWSKDDDYLNNTYTKNYDGDVFGQSEFEVENDFLVIEFLNEQMGTISETSQKRKEAVLQRWAKVKQKDTSVLNKDTSVLQSDTDKIREDKIRKENIINNAVFVFECKNSTQWIEVTAMQNKISPDVVNVYIDNFENHLITMQEQKKTLKEYKEHFTHWFKKQDLSEFRIKSYGKTNQI